MKKDYRREHLSQADMIEVETNYAQDCPACAEARAAFRAWLVADAPAPHVVSGGGHTHLAEGDR